MKALGDEIANGLVRAARSEDPEAFDAALDHLLDRARDESAPEGDLQSLVAQRLESALRVDPPGAPKLAGGKAPLTVAPRWARALKALGLLAAGITIGFIWGRSPEMWPQDRRTATDVSVAPVTESAERSSPGDDALVSRSNEPAAAIARSAEQGDATRPAAVADFENSTRSEAPAKSRTHGPAASVVHSRRVPAASSVPPAAARLPDAESLRFALEQLRKAQLGLRSGDPRGALGALDLLDARVAPSVLRDEREVTRSLAWCDTGDADDRAKANDLARRFLEREPASAYSASLRESCAGKTTLLEQMRERTSNPSR